MELSEILECAARLASDRDRLRQKKSGVVMFIDMVGSTAFKDAHPDEEEWLARLVTFLSSVTSIVEQHGRVVKYIGDEVMALFDGDNSVMNAEHAAEQILSFCQRYGAQDPFV